MALLSQIKTWAYEKLTYAALNAEFQNIYSHLTTDYIEDASASDGEMQATQDPYPASVISKPTTLREELKVLRYAIKGVTGKTYWYEDPARTLEQCVGAAEDNTLSGSNEFTASQHLDGDALLLRFRDTGASGKEWGIRSDGGNLELCENTGTEGSPTWTVRKTFYASRSDGYIASSPAADLSATGPKTTLTAAEDLTFGACTYTNASSKQAKGDADSITTSGITHMALATISTDASGEFAGPGSYVRNDAWSWTPGGYLYLDTTTAGGMTQTPPSGTDDAIQIIGKAETATVIFFNPQLLMYTHT